MIFGLSNIKGVGNVPAFKHVCKFMLRLPRQNKLNSYDEAGKRVKLHIVGPRLRFDGRGLPGPGRPVGGSLLTRRV